MKLPGAALEAAHLIDRLDRVARGREAASGLNPAQWEALRFIARANRFSRTPAALAEYVGSTRGTISQTLIVLEQKGHVVRKPSARDGRSIELQLTAAGERTLKDDPILLLAADLAQAGATGLDAVAGVLRGALHSLIERNGGRPFGACFRCRHFRRNAKDGARNPHHCALLDEPLSEADSAAICIEHEGA